MDKGNAAPFDADRDLVFERVIDVPSEAVWVAWTSPELLKKWFTPAPWQTIECQVDLRPGGIFRTVMRGPEGQEFDNAGCYLEIVPPRRLVWTGALAPGYRPRTQSELMVTPFFMTAAITLEPVGRSTIYTARAIHGDIPSRERHEAMGFHSGWGKSLDQLLALIK